MSATIIAKGVEVRKVGYEGLDLATRNMILNLRLTEEPVPTKLLPSLHVVLMYIVDLYLGARKNFCYRAPGRKFVSVTNFRDRKNFASTFCKKIKSYESKEPLFSHVGIDFDQSFDTLGELEEELKKILEKTPEESTGEKREMDDCEKNLGQRSRKRVRKPSQKSRKE